MVNILFQDTLPNYDYSPSSVGKNLLVSNISILIFLKFLHPEFGTRCWGGCVSTSLVSMPETAIDENNGLVFFQDKIGFAW
jgi:hypothetical protein